jgi:hypothetical protein
VVKRRTDLAKECYLQQVDDEDKATATSSRVLRVGADSIGALAIRGNLGTLVINALASLTAVTLDRCVSFQKENEIEAAKQGRTAESRRAGFTGPCGQDAAYSDSGGE